jgi:hypothetical protein
VPFHSLENFTALAFISFQLSAIDSGDLLK